jgi:hypothetical protein
MHSAPPKLTVVDKPRTKGFRRPILEILDDYRSQFLHGSLKPRRSRETRLILFPGTVWYACSTSTVPDGIGKLKPTIAVIARW